MDGQESQPIALDTIRFTPRTVKELEDRTKRPIVESISESNMGSLLAFVQKGLDMNEDQAYKAIEDYLAQGKDTTELQIFIIKKLEEQGFLPRKLNLSQKIQDKIDQLASQDSLDSVGPKESQLQ